jgi:hypothetical protein
VRDSGISVGHEFKEITRNSLLLTPHPRPFSMREKGAKRTLEVPLRFAVEETTVCENLVRVTQNLTPYPLSGRRAEG